jgi:hypothetical protein
MTAILSLPKRKSMGRLCRLLLICLPFLLTRILLAQDTGQVCVLSYEDRDGDGSRDADERSIAHGIGASLLNTSGVTIASALLDDSPFAANGLICFDQLLAGEYQILLTSAEFASTASASFTASVNPGEAPARFEFGARSLHLAESAGASATAIAVDAAAAEALVQGLIDGAIIFVIMSVTGLLICLLVFRRRFKRVAAMPYPPPVAPTQNPSLFADDYTDAPRAD